MSEYGVNSVMSTRECILQGVPIIRFYYVLESTKNLVQVSNPLFTTIDFKTHHLSKLAHIMTIIDSNISFYYVVWHPTTH